MSCNYGGYKTYRHSRLVAKLRAILREAGCRVAPREVEVPGWRLPDGRGARLEVSYVEDGARHFADVSIRSPYRADLLAQAAAGDGVAARRGEEDKLADYPAVPDAGLDAVQPFVLESFGRLGQCAQDMLRHLRQRLAEEAPHLRGWAGHALYNRWLAQLSVALQESHFTSAQAAWGCGGAPREVRQHPAEPVAPLVWAVLPFAGEA